MNIEDTNFSSYIFSSWITKLLWKAYHKGITLSDLPEMPSMDSCAYNSRKFENLWNRELRQRGPSSASLLIVSWQFVRVRFLISCTLSMFAQIMTFILYTSLLRKLLECREKSSEMDFASGMYWVLLITGTDVIQTVISTWRDIMNHRTALRLKAACTGIMFKKITTSDKIRISSQDTEKVSDAISEDCKDIYNIVNAGASIIDGPVVIVCSLVCFPLWLSPVALSGLLVYSLIYLIQYWLQRRIEHYKDIATEYSRSRTQKTLQILKSLRTIEILGWKQHFMQQITNSRRKESKWLWRFSCLKSLNSAISQTKSIMVVIVIFFLHSTIYHSLNAALAYPICAVIVVQMHDAFDATRIAILSLKSSREIFNRIKNRLHSIGDVNCYTTKPQEPSHAVTIVQGSFFYETSKSQDQQSSSAEPSLERDSNDQADESTINPEDQILEDSAFEDKRSIVLKGINFKAKKGQLIGICGQLGSGKSSLLLAALGQMRLTSGQVMRQGSCAYTAQMPWLLDATIKENLLFQEPFDAKRYYEAQIISQLREDIKKYPDGDETMIGDDGILLSKALRQKIALARAFYANRDIYFLDEPLEDIGLEASREIFEDLIIKALTEKTILLVTNELEFLDRCDYIYVMHEGSIAEHGRQRELIRLDKRYAMMVKNSANDGSSSEKSDSQDGSMESKPDSRVGCNHDNAVPSSDSNSYMGLTNNSTRESKKTKPESVEIETYFVFMKFLNSIFLIYPVILTYVIYASTQILSLLRLSWWLESIEPDYVAETDGKRDSLLYRDWFGFCLFLVILGGLIQSYIVQSALTEVMSNFHETLIKKFMHASTTILHTTSFEKMKDNSLLNFNKVSFTMPNLMDNAFRCIILALFTSFILMSTIPWFTNYVVIASIICIFLCKIYRVAIFHLKWLENTSEQTNRRFLQKSFIGLDTIRTFKKENDQLSKFQDLVDANNMCCILQDISGKWLTVRLKVLGSTCLFVATTLIVFLGKDVSSSMGGLTILYILQIPHVVWKSVRYSMKFEDDFVRVQSILNDVKALQAVENGPRAPSIINSGWPKAGQVEFDRVSFHCDKEAPWGLNQSSFTISHAEKIGILVLTDIDLESMIAAMYRFCELDEGKIIIDNIDISTIPLEVLRSQISIIPSNPIFYGTIRFFLDPTKCHTDVELWNSLDKIQLKDKVSRMNSQLHCVNFGENLSIDEQRLLFLARALLRENKILLYEETTTSQSKVASLVRRIVLEEFKNCTVLMISCCLQTVLSYDRFIIIDMGDICELDIHSVSNSDSLSKILARTRRKRRKSDSSAHCLD